MELLERDAAAERCGMKPASLSHALSASLALVEAGEELTIWDCPLPEDYVRVPRKSEGRMGPGRVRVPRWDPAKLDAWRAAGRRPPHKPRPRDGAGRYLSRAS